METDGENNDNVNLKRQRAPLSDSEDDASTSSETNDVQKRPRLEASGPKASSSARLAELEAKPDTPIVPSVRSRVQQLTQRRDGVPPAQRCFSDPGADNSPSVFDNRGCRPHLLGEGEFHQRLERFKLPLCQPSPAPMPSPTGTFPQVSANFISGIQQKLQCPTTPSSQQACVMREERKQELSQLQPISQNAWLKRSSSDSMLSQADGDVEIKDGSFTEVLASGAEKRSADVGGERMLCDSNIQAASIENESSNGGKLQTEQGEQIYLQGEEVREEKESKASVGDEQKKLLLKLSFSEEQSFSREPCREDQNDEQSFLESTLREESNIKEMVSVPKGAERGSSEVFSFDEMDQSQSLSYGEEEMEPSTDEELRSWRYPRDLGCQEDESRSAEGQVEDMSARMEEGSVGGSCEVWGIQDGEGDVCKGRKPRPGDDGVESESPPDVFVTSRDQATSNKHLGGVDSSKRTDSADATEQEPSVSAGSQSLTLHIEDDGKENITGATNDEDGTSSKSEVRAEVSDIGVQCLTEEPEPDAVGGGRPFAHGLSDGGESSKRVSFLLEPELINDSIQSPIDTSTESRADAEQSSHNDQMFEEVLDCAGRAEEERNDNDDDTEGHDSGICACSGDKDKVETESEKDKSEEEEAKEEEELLTFPSSGILSPLGKSVEAVVTPLRLAVSRESNPPLLLGPDETSTPPADSAPLYSVDAYRTQRQSKPSLAQSVAPAVQRQETQLPPSVNVKETIAALGEEAGKLQTVINQTLQALSCCTDEEHGRGSQEEAEAEKLLLVSCEKRAALLAEVTRLREERGSESAEAEGAYISQQPCRGTVSISDIRLPLKVEFVCSSHNKTGRPSHYFFILIRSGPGSIVATPLATAADAQNGDTVSFATSVTLKDVCSSFEIDVEVYSLSQSSGGTCSVDRPPTKSRVTPRKLLNTITQRSNHSLTSSGLPAVVARRSSNFCLVGSHKITLASLGLGRFPLDKMKLEGKIRRLLGDEFQEKVPFLSPLEGNVYLRLDSQSHSNVQHQGFLTVFELISGYGVWHRRYFVLEGCMMLYWNHPNDKETKAAEGSVSLSGSPSRRVRPVRRDSCARPFTFELASDAPQQQQDDSQDAVAKCRFSADTKQDRLDWMERLNQALLDFHTWNRSSAPQTEGLQSKPSSSGGNLRESIL
ncbi:anillin, actin binding protein 2 [Brachionichthys hirsutus]|uniref:anillin, actin binding protein 2 n=1 Tax=Brachionichthys hirsutus TaxID=412623 RepID=UPI0036053E1D